jgi:hypothetical protein
MCSMMYTPNLHFTVDTPTSTAQSPAPLRTKTQMSDAPIPPSLRIDTPISVTRDTLLNDVLSGSLSSHSPIPWALGQNTLVPTAVIPSVQIESPSGMIAPNAHTRTGNPTIKTARIPLVKGIPTTNATTATPLIMITRPRIVQSKIS